MDLGRLISLFAGAASVAIVYLAWRALVGPFAPGLPAPPSASGYQTGAYVPFVVTDAYTTPVVFTCATSRAVILYPPLSGPIPTTTPPPPNTFVPTSTP